MDPLEEALRNLARESGRALGELGVRPADGKWIREHAETVASLAGKRTANGFWRLFRRSLKSRT